MNLRYQIDRLLELPALIDAPARRLTALRAERRKADHRLEACENRVRMACMRSDDYRTARNAQERQAIYLSQLYYDDEYQRLTNRRDELGVAIDNATADKEALEREYKALRAALEGRYAEILEAVLTDRTLAEAVARHPEFRA